MSDKSTTIQNGKGDAPRNIGPKFREHYDSIFRKKTKLREQPKRHKHPN